MTRLTRQLVLGACAAALMTAPALAGWGDRQPHRRVTISGGCEACDFAGQNLSDAMIVGAHFTGSDFSHATLINAGLQECAFQDTSFADANLAGARLSGVAFIESDLSGMHLTGARGDRVRFTNSDLDGADLSGGRFVLVSFTGSDLTDAIFTRTEFHHADLTGATLDETVFRDSRLTGANLSGARGDRTVFVNTDLRGANLSGAEFDRAEFTGARLEGAVLSGARLERARGLTAAQLAQACGDEGTELPGNLSVAPCPPRAPRPENVFVVSGTNGAVQVVDRQRMIEAQAAAVEALRRVEVQMPDDVRIEVRRSGELAEVRRAISEALEELRREEERASARLERDAARAEADAENARREAEIAAARAQLEALEALMRDHSFPPEVAGTPDGYTYVFTPDSGAEGFRWEFRTEARPSPSTAPRLEGEVPLPPLPSKPAEVTPRGEGD